VPESRAEAERRAHINGIPTFGHMASVDAVLRA
jgi:hypothetical protein